LWFDDDFVIDFCQGFINDTRPLIALCKRIRDEPVHLIPPGRVQDAIGNLRQRFARHGCEELVAIAKIHEKLEASFLKDSLAAELAAVEEMLESVKKDSNEDFDFAGLLHGDLDWRKSAPTLSKLANELVSAEAVRAFPRLQRRNKNSDRSAGALES